MRASDEQAYHSLMAYTLSLGDSSFIHQHVVDAYAVQAANADSKPIGVIFGLVGLYLHVERGFSGRRVQSAHMRLARTRRNWILPPLPEDRGRITASDVLANSPGEQRNLMISEWCRSAWMSWDGEHGFIADLVREQMLDRE